MREQGELEFGRGTGIRITQKGSVEGAGKVERSSAKRLYLHIKNGILEGKYRCGDRLPKRDHFVVECHVSSHTVAEALKKLAGEGLVHRKGKACVVGKAPEVRKRPQHDSPVILVVQNSSDTWRGLRNERTIRFVERFAGEAQRFGFRLQSFFLSEQNPGNMQPFGSMRDLTAFISELDHLYFGSIIIGNPEHYTDFRDLVRKLISIRRPVAWFDKSYRTPVAPNLSPYYYHFHFSERRIASAAVQHLVEHGHSHLCYMDVTKVDWAAQRGIYLSQAAKSHSEVRLSKTDELYEELISGGYERIHALLRQKLEAPSMCLRKAAAFIAAENGYEIGANSSFPQSVVSDIARFFIEEPTMDDSEIGRLRNARELLTAFLDESITALIFPRDRAARGFCRTMGYMNIQAPEDISLMSFDNYDDPTVFPSNTVDIGADQLGYQAFHAISGIAPIKRNCKDGSISAVPEVVDRGSVARLKPLEKEPA
jgi:DNA-binding LacI/PurR family transcriptional regulator/DNA-binding transcriptional regulator YhcF (GntR family)